MSKAKHTPGPWEYDPESDYHNDPKGTAYVDRRHRRYQMLTVDSFASTKGKRRKPTPT